MISKIILLIIRLGSGFYMLFQGYEKLTGGFAIDGLVSVIKENQDSPAWFKFFFEAVVANHLEIFKWMVQLGEIAIGLSLILGVLSYTASFFGVFYNVKLYSCRYYFHIPNSIVFLYNYINE